MDVTSKLQSFIAQYTGVITGDTPQNTNQCVGLVEKWLDVFSLPHIWGDAKDLFANADAGAYTKILNTPTNSPSPGDIFVFDGTYGGGFGHTGVVTTADTNSVTLFQQNDPLGHAPQLKTYPYLPGAIGWLHPNIFPATVTQTVTEQQSTDLLNKQIEATAACQNQLKQANDQNASLQSQLTTATNELESSQGKLSDANSQVVQLQKKLQSEQSEIVHLNSVIETQAKSNKDYAQEVLDLSHENTDLENYLNATADKLGINRTGEKDADIQEGILTKLDSIDILLKAAGVASGLLHEVAQVLQVDIKNATDKDIANKIISYVKSLQGTLKSLNPKAQQQIETQIQSPSFWSRLIGFFWVKKS